MNPEITIKLTGKTDLLKGYEVYNLLTDLLPEDVMVEVTYSVETAVVIDEAFTERSFDFVLTAEDYKKLKEIAGQGEDNV